jgi:uncharacterized repeat protein (TIGR01451 family)/LPXTG-motif cell wall-anchored protein
MTTTTSAMRPRARLFIALIATLSILAAQLSVFATESSADHISGHETYPATAAANNPSYWETYGATNFDETWTCTKNDAGANSPYVLGDPPAGEVWRLLVVKAGNDHNDLYFNPTPGQGYVATGQGGGGWSHVITCSMTPPPPPPGEGTIVVAKVVDGDGDAPAGDFGFTLVCADGTSETFTLGDGDDDTFTREGGFEGCEVTETDDLDADATSWAITGAVTDSGSGTATGDDPGFDVGEDQTATVTFTNTFDAPPPPPTEPGISLVKTATAIPGDDLVPGELVQFNGDKIYTITPEVAGDVHTITYVFDITNTGDVTLFNVTLTDPMLGGEITIEDTTLAPGASTTGTATYDLTDEDIATGTVPNTATVTGEDDEGTEVSDTDDETISIVVVDPTQLAPSISVVKDAVDGITDDGEGNLLVTITGQDGTATVTYRYVVTNTGDDDLTDLTLIDDKIGDLTDDLVAAVTAEYGGPVLPVDGQVTITAIHEVSASDFDGITLTNLVDVTGLGVDSGATVNDDDTETVVLIQVLDVVEEAEEEEATASTRLPRTGLNSAGLTGLGLLLAMLGAATLLFTRRRADTA